MLQCSGNYLTAVPGSLAASCPLLEQLGLDRNRLAFLPHTLGALARLVALSADDNPHLRCPPPEVPPPSREAASPRPQERAGVDGRASRRVGRS